MPTQKTVLLINPWAVHNDQYYASGFVDGMNRQARLDFVTNYYYAGCLPNGKLYRFFFQYSEHMSPGWLRKFVRGVEYVLAWHRIIRLARHKKYDVIHIHWLLNYKIDIHYVKKLKQTGALLVLTAHNVLPHVNGSTYLRALHTLYGLFDKILVHGQAIKQEFIQFFPDYQERVSIQYHATYHQQNTTYTPSTQEDYQRIACFIAQYNRVFITFGKQFYNKGTDRLIKLWKQTVPTDASTGLLVLGKSSFYPQLQQQIQEGLPSNMLLIDKFLDDNTLNFAITKSCCIILPYRHASMSGIIYTAAAFAKPVLCTRAGALAEYVISGMHGLVCEVDDPSLQRALVEGLALPADKWKQMGIALQKHIQTHYSWPAVTQALYRDVYQNKGGVL